MTCEVCGAPAVVLIQDTREVEPLKVDGEYYAQRVKEGPRHAFCEAHRRKPIRHPRTEPAPA
jgi:hypothetical protein